MMISLQLESEVNRVNRAVRVALQAQCVFPQVS